MSTTVERIALLQAIPFLADQRPEDLVPFLELAEWQERPPGDCIIEQATESGDMWLVVTGSVAATMGDGPNLVVLADLPLGEVVGAVTMYRRTGLHPARVTAMEPCSVLRFDSEVITTLASGGSTIPLAIERAVISQLASRLRACNEAIVEARNPKSRNAFSQVVHKLKGLLRG